MPPSDAKLASPFLDSASFALPQTELEAPPAFPMAGSPFLAAYERSPDTDLLDPEAEEYVVFLNELYDEEMDGALFELAAETSTLYEQLVENEYAGGSTLPAPTLRRLEDHFAPLARELETTLDAMAETAQRQDLRTLNEAELDAFFDGFAPSQPLAPVFDDFFGKLKNTFKKVVKKGVNLAKRGLKFAAKLGLGPLLAKLRGLVRPLLRRVLKHAINRLPPALRPHAQQLAKRLPFLAEVEEESLLAAETGAGVSALQQELNAQLANLVFADNEVELEQEAAAYAANPGEASDPLQELDQARERFIQQIAELEAGGDAAPYVENFVPAILPALKLGVKLAGRKRVVAFLANLVARLIRRFVGGGMASPLSQALADAGLRLINLEAAPLDEARAAGAAVAATVEDMVRQVAALPDHVLDNEALLEGYALAAFEQAAAANLPPLLSAEAYLRRPDLRQERSLAGAWVALPLRKRRRYKKFTRIPRLHISPYQARAVKTFGGLTLANYLQDQLGLPPGEEVEAHMHLYEAMPGATLPAIVQHEQGVPGLDAPGAAAHLHPLTQEAAGLLLGEPALGETSPGQAATEPLSDAPQAVQPGRRFYYLQIAGARPQLALGPGGRPAPRRSRRTRLVLDFPGNQVRVRHFLSEADAQTAALKLRQNAPTGAVLAALMPPLEQGIDAALAGHGVKIIHGRVAPGPSQAAHLRRVPPATLARLADEVKRQISSALAAYLATQPQTFLSAAADPADGVTLRAVIANPAGLGPLNDALQGRPVAQTWGRDRMVPPPVTLQAVSGYERE